MPIEGHAELLVNPGFYPKDDGQFYYRAVDSVAKRIVVGEQDLVGMGLSNATTIYVKIVCPNTCRYILKSTRVDDGVLDIKTGYSEVGSMAGKEVRQHLLINKDFTGEAMAKRFTIKLQLYSGEANLYVKNCPPGKPCNVDEAELSPTSQPVDIVAHRGVKAIK